MNDDQAPNGCLALIMAGCLIGFGYAAWSTYGNVPGWVTAFLSLFGLFSVPAALVFTAAALNPPLKTPPPMPAGPSAPAPPQAMDRARAMQVLGLREPFTPDELRAAYRNQMRQYHPDLTANLGPDIRTLAEAKAKEINAALDVLS